jgi:hypothetical protein
MVAGRSIAALFAQLSCQSTPERRVLRCQPHPTSDAAADIPHISEGYSPAVLTNQMAWATQHI